MPSIDRPAEIVPGLSSIASRYDVILCDVWGVLHDGVVAFAPAGDALVRFRATGGRVVLVTNAPRPAGSVARQLARLGVPRAAWDAIVTSGDLTRSSVIERKDRVVHHLGPERDNPVFAGLDIRFDGIDQADYVVCTGLFDDSRETVEDYRGTLERMLARRLLMICANPDLVVERGQDLIPCAGALALRYEELGGKTLYTGKPHRPIYEAALALAAEHDGGKPVDRARVLAVGDAIRTDIAGACGLGLTSLLIAGGIHSAEIGLSDAPLTSSRLGAWLSRQAVKPDAVSEVLTWS